MFRRKVQQSAASGGAASGVAHFDFGSRFGTRRAEGGARHDASGKTEQWNAGRDRATDHDARDFDAESSDETGSMRSVMPSHNEYCSLLSEAIAGLEQDSYATRGAVYDRECKSLMRKLYSANPPFTDVEIDAELRAFRNAVKTVEFRLDEPGVVPVSNNTGPSDPSSEHRNRTGTLKDYSNPRDEHEGFRQAPEVVSPVAAPNVGRNRSSGTHAESQRRPLRDPPSWSKRQPVQTVPSAQIESALEEALNLASPEPPPAGNFDQPEVEASVLQLDKRKPVSRRILGRALFAVALLAIGTAGYDFLTGDLDLPLLRAITSGSVSGSSLRASSTNVPPQRALLFDGSRPDLNGTKFEGKVYWQMRMENSGAASVPIIQLDLDVPGRRVAMTMVMRREPAGSSMSHIFEIRFIGDDQQPDPDITGIAGIVMANADMSRPNTLTGQAVSVRPGVFIFGLSGLPSEREQNLRKLAEFPWIGMPIVYRNGTTGVVTFEKGDEGNKVINEALDRWASAS